MVNVLLILMLLLKSFLNQASSSSSLRLLRLLTQALLLHGKHPLERDSSSPLSSQSGGDTESQPKN